MPQKLINQSLIRDLEQALKHVGDYGSVEIYIQASRITQITTRKIRKTKHSLNGEAKHSAAAKSL